MPKLNANLYEYRSICLGYGALPQNTINRLCLPSRFSDHHFSASLVEEFPQFFRFEVHLGVVLHLLLGLQGLQRPEVGRGRLVPQRGEVEARLRGAHQLVHDGLPQAARQGERSAVRERQGREEGRLVAQHCTHGKVRTPVRYERMISHTCSWYDRVSHQEAHPSSGTEYFLAIGFRMNADQA